MKRLTAMAALFTLAACSSSNSTGPTDPCALDISNAYYYYGTPDSRTESANGLISVGGESSGRTSASPMAHALSTRGSDQEPWNFLIGDPPMKKCRSISGRHFFVWYVGPEEPA